jgi:hypothetical protein
MLIDLSFLGSKSLSFSTLNRTSQLSLLSSPQPLNTPVAPACHVEALVKMEASREWSNWDERRGRQRREVAVEPSGSCRDTRRINISTPLVLFVTDSSIQSTGFPFSAS